MCIRFFQFTDLLYLGVFFITAIKYCEFNETASTKFFSNATAMQFFRFRDFEPRYTTPTNSYRPFENKRKPRGFQFHTDDRDFSVELEFIIPFIRIPIERSVTATQTAFRSLLNLNVQSLLTTGAIVAIGGVFAILLKIIFTQYAYISNYSPTKSYRSYDFNEQNPNLFGQAFNSNNSEYTSNINKLTKIMESKLSENNINISHCIQSCLCSFAQSNFYNTNQTPSGGIPRILEGVYSLDFVQDYLKGSAVKYALDVAKNANSCFQVFSNCNWPVSPNIIKMFAENLSFINII